MHHAVANPTWVTVVCTCYNQAPYVATALQSVVTQCYPHVQLIVLDNASTDGSADHIRAFIRRYPDTVFIRNSENKGLCRAFNQGLRLARGAYLIDLAADDVLLPGRITRQVAAFNQLPGHYAVVFGNAAYIDAGGHPLGYHYPVNSAGRARKPVPSGDVFRPLLMQSFICAPTMMIRRSVLDELGGYDESLAFEDFDFWVRSARRYAYAYVDEVLTHKRQLPHSMATQVLDPGNPLLASTLQVCLKAFDSCRTPDEYAALARRLRPYVRRAFYAEQFELARQFGELLTRMERPGKLTAGILLLCRLRPRVNNFYKIYWRIRSGFVFRPWQKGPAHSDAGPGLARVK